ncbi:AglZ/HisF2 family acetamidino modification protein [Glaciecola petra]|uniref:imidazole glycerol-phosphate synthase n=1 Tax=Glaciecola petra TaxID=3075602 RepID=A0ABU2ZM24_9ALTE|nr:AglZ/HisF2 family acetamidino modification protein [Aestuariibacter sp. P117]MDT0593672.1 AglZ/HisF2 family acetamidino modification protein [Aestuariibacter sp. P117]
MLRSRVSPCLLIHKNGLVKTEKFKTHKYVGDPINAVKIFNEKEVDEIIILDIDATVNKSEPNYKLIKNIANESRMPVCYGGGVNTVEQAKKIIQLGIEKVAFSSAILEDPTILTPLCNAIGKQSVVVVLDVKKNFLGKYEIFTHNGTKKVKKKLEEVLRQIESFGVGEIVVNSIDRDGTMKGYDFDLVDIVRQKTDSPITILGGASNFDDILNLIKRYKVIGASVGSLFVFKGVYKAVLISYLNDVTKNEIVKVAEKNFRSD